ncbi:MULTISPECIES: hypothetical protein [Brachybacterium]|uniref:Uncharacterized protein n=1 Tax=Brachybacterium kimchii TaxID=2942909 RepID=A0ABY4N8Z5_9MICO|nr:MULTISPECIES: hypothetical protein [Brachybacterium]MCG7308057.1 hypothetical protein [Brachybacterium sp. ACRRE]UQN30579.1 hypothetical protein M4486_04500 [Brachybacterium kimchii]
MLPLLCGVLAVVLAYAAVRTIRSEDTPAFASALLLLGAVSSLLGAFANT